MEFLNRYANLVHWLPRVALAGIFIPHGISKFTMGQAMADGMGMPVIMIYMIGLMELTVGVCMIVGALGRDMLTRLAGLLIAMVMLGAIFMVHWPQWFFMATEAKPMGGMELQVLTMTVGLYFLVKGNDAN
ncbi:MAG: DoxX family protein [Candidatus Marinimicrobia bacterium]|nr:DoxX family protein [Candidatus Neomarinimicrobiota bacterium]